MPPRRVRWRRSSGLKHTDKVITGRELEQISDEDLPQMAQDVDVFARASPEHKLRLVQALQSKREICAMTGDGVKRCPGAEARRCRDQHGAEGHRKPPRGPPPWCSHDDNFASIQRAIEEGRTVYDNLRKAILFILPTNARAGADRGHGDHGGAGAAVSPVQILWVTVITAVTLGIAFAWGKGRGQRHETQAPARRRAAD